MAGNLFIQALHRLGQKFLGTYQIQISTNADFYQRSIGFMELTLNWMKIPTKVIRTSTNNFKRLDIRNYQEK
jgi:hypothetical protein